MVSTDGLFLPGWISFISEADLAFPSFQPLNHRKGDLKDLVCGFSDTDRQFFRMSENACWYGEKSSELF